MAVPRKGRVHSKLIRVRPKNRQKDDSRLRMDEVEAAGSYQFYTAALAHIVHSDFRFLERQQERLG